MLKKCLAICDEQSRETVAKWMGETPLRFVCSDSELEGLASEETASFDGIIVFAELAWGKHALSHFFGIDVAVELRLRMKMLAPMCILSFMPQVYFTGCDEIRYNILKARGSRFVRLPAETNDVVSALESTLPLSQATLVYLSNLLVDVQHLIDLLRHDLRMSADCDKLCQSLKKIDLLSSTVIYQDLINVAENILKAHRDGNEERFYTLTNEMVKRLGVFYQQTKPQYDDQTRHKIILVDDNPEDLAWATAALEERFEVLPFREAMEAKHCIDEDTGNNIAAIISDWQLLKPRTDEHQEMLGFELLDYAAKKGHYALFSLTSTDDSSICEIDPYLGFDHTLITKDFHHDVALWRMYIPIIRQKIDRNLALIASLPTGEAWNNDFKLDYRNENGKKVAFKKYFKSFRQQYVEKRNASNWRSYESGISTLTDQLWQYYKRAFDADSRMELFDLKTQWGMELNRELQNMLVVRRIFLAFWFNKTKLDIGFRVPQKGWVEDPVINIYSVLRRRYFNDLSDERGGIDDEKTYKDLNNAAKVFVNQLAIEPNRLPQGVLPEERAWLRRKGIDVEAGNDNYYSEFQ